MQVLICGAGRIVVEVLRRLGQGWRVTVIDLNNILTWEQMLFTIKLLGLALLVKLMPSLLFVLNRISAYESLKLGFLLSSRLSLIVVAASIGYEAGFITAAYKDSIILLAVCTCLTGPTLFKMLYSLSRHRLRV
ncbi:MAG: hypothetical protein R6U55_10420 [Desulfovermiculus sp.]